MSRGGTLTGELIANRLDEEPHLRPLYEEMSDEQARIHFGEAEIVDTEHLRRSMRLFHAWRVHTLRERLGERLPNAEVVDVGDSDGLILKALGKDGIGFNLSEAAVRNIEANGVRAVLGDGHEMPFEESSFDVVLCFETLEHVEAPHQLLMELARLVRPGGRVFVSIPWVPSTFVHARHPQTPRGQMHVFEFSRKDFEALLTHTPLEVIWAENCEILGRPRSLMQRLLLASRRGDHVVGGTFRRFQFFELAPR